ncbi:MAG TPA: hypothetical protein VNQ97_02975, partial [Burkholderiaceae bacterium]|nr:hypothetical protein [Burkholderiaceae bacterium]
ADYLAFRAQVRAPAWQAQFLAKPLPERRAFAEEARARSKSMSSNKPEDIMDVTPEAVATILQEHDVQFLIHGHTHRPNVHNLQVDGEPAWRLVLGDWRDTEAKYLRIDAAGAHMERFIYP